MNRVSLNQLARKAQLQFARVVDNEQLNTQEVVFHYDAAVLPPNYDPNDRATYPTPVAATRPFNALVHWVSSSSKLFGPQEMEVGDAVLFLKPEQDITGNAPWFEIAGENWVQKQCGGAIARDWSLNIGGTMIHRAVLLTRQM